MRPFHALRVPHVKPALDRAVKIEHAERFPRGRPKRNNKLCIRRAVAGDMSGERVNVRHALRRVFGNSAAAHAPAARDARAGGLALKRSQGQHVAVQQIESRPIQPLRFVIEVSGGVCKRGHRVCFILQQSRKARNEIVNFHEQQYSIPVSLLYSVFSV